MLRIALTSCFILVGQSCSDNQNCSVAPVTKERLAKPKTPPYRGRVSDHVYYAVLKCPVN